MEYELILAKYGNLQPASDMFFHELSMYVSALMNLVRQEEAKKGAVPTSF